MPFSQIISIDVEGLLEVFKCLSEETHPHLKFTEISVDLRGHDVRGAENFKAAIDARLK